MPALQNSSPAVAVLGSAVGLGVYLPALMVSGQLGSLGFAGSEAMLESYLGKEELDAIAKTKESFQKNFRLAQIAYSMPSAQKQNSLTPAATELLQTWQKAGVRHFIVFSGIWMPVLAEYATLAGPFSLDCCHIDVTSPSWQQAVIPAQASARHIHFFDSERHRVNYHIMPQGARFHSWDERGNDLVIHGGGWGIGRMGEYVDAIPAEAYHLKIVVLKAEDADLSKPGRSYYMIKAGWNALSQPGNVCEFPPMSRIGAGGISPLHIDGSRHVLYNAIASAKAIISKPGGMTLMDSFTSATPLVYIDSLQHEDKNSALWKSAGFGISFNEWKDSGYSEALLHSLHRNILKARENTPDYPQNYSDHIHNHH